MGNKYQNIKKLSCVVFFGHPDIRGHFPETVDVPKLVSFYPGLEVLESQK